MANQYEKEIGFVRARRVGHHIAASGTAPLDGDGNTVAHGDVYEQTKRCLEIIVAAITAKGGSLATIARTRIMLVDVTQWKHAARAHAEVFAESLPACTFVEVSRFIDEAWLVEVEADAIVD